MKRITIPLEAIVLVVLCFFIGSPHFKHAFYIGCLAVVVITARIVLKYIKQLIDQGNK